MRFYVLQDLFQQFNLHSRDLKTLLIVGNKICIDKRKNRLQKQRAALRSVKSIAVNINQTEQ